LLNSINTVFPESGVKTNKYKE